MCSFCGELLLAKAFEFEVEFVTVVTAAAAMATALALRPSPRSCEMFAKLIWLMLLVEKSVEECPPPVL